MEHVGKPAIGCLPDEQIDVQVVVVHMHVQAGFRELGRLGTGDQVHVFRARDL